MFPRALFLYLSLLVASVSCQSKDQIPIVQHHAPNNRTVSPQLFAELEELSRIVDISYCVGDLGLGIKKPFSCASRCKDFENFELVAVQPINFPLFSAVSLTKRVSQTWNTGPLLSDSCGYIALSHPPSPRRLILAFRGTYSLTNAIADLSTIPQEYTPYPGTDDPNAQPKCPNCTIHTGFYTSWRNTRTVIKPYLTMALENYPNYPLVLVGHSLGGAVAAIAALEFQVLGYNPTVTTFGEPRIGNAALAAYLDARFKLTPVLPSENPAFRRVTHIDDPVPLLPLDEWGYVQHGGEIFIAKKDLPPSVEDVRFCAEKGGGGCSGSWGWWKRLQMWQLFFAHRDYFWRLGLCVPDMGFWDRLRLCGE